MPQIISKIKNDLYIFGPWIKFNEKRKVSKKIESKLIE